MAPPSVLCAFLSAQAVFVGGRARVALGAALPCVRRRPRRVAAVPAPARAPPQMGLFDVLRKAVAGMRGVDAERKMRREEEKRTKKVVLGGGGANGTEKVERYLGRVERINAMEEAMEDMSGEEMRARVEELRAEVAQGVQQGKDRGVIVDGFLEEVFAMVREASFRVLGLRHYDVQLVGGMVLWEGNVAEMATGEGKTIVAALAAGVGAVAGEGAVVVTVNDYLAERDAGIVGQVLSYLGIGVGLVLNGMSTEERRKGYAHEVCYVTNSEMGFDYLRDNLALGKEDLVVERSFGFCVVDEADSILIDEARTPLIISGKVPIETTKYDIAARAAAGLSEYRHYNVDRKEQTVLLTEEGYAMLEVGLEVDNLFDVRNPWAPYITNALKAKELFQDDVHYIVDRKENVVQIVDEFTGRVMEGRRWSDGLHQAVEAKEGLRVQNEATTIASVSYQAFFKLFPRLAGMTGTAATEAIELKDIYGLEVVAVPTALPVARRDYDDVVFKTSEAKYRAIMAEIARVVPTGRPVLVGTTSIEASEALSNLLKEVEVPHEVLNAKPESALRESEIIAQAGRKYSITIATNMAGRGTDILLGGNAEYFARALARKELVAQNEKLYDKMVADTETGILIDDEDLPCPLSDEAFDLLGDAAEEVAEVCDICTLLSIDEIVALAAEYGPIPPEFGDGVEALREAMNKIKVELSDTIAKERQAVIDAGGLYVIGTERAESRRVDNQLRGRAGRQGDPGASRFFLALDDRLFRVFGGDRVTSLLNTFRVEENMPIENKAVSAALDNAQQNVEKYYADIRKQMFTYDEVMSTQRAALYSLRRSVLTSNSAEIRNQLVTFSVDTSAEIVGAFIGRGNEDGNDFDGLSNKLRQFFPGMAGVSPGELAAAAEDGGLRSVREVVKVAVVDAIREKEYVLEERRFGLSTEVSRYLVLTQIDNLWQEHMKSMNYLKEFVVLRQYSAENPLEVYQAEGFELFQTMLGNVRRNQVYSYFQYQIEASAVPDPAVAK